MCQKGQTGASTRIRATEKQWVSGHPGGQTIFHSTVSSCQNDCSLSPAPLIYRGKKTGARLAPISLQAIAPRHLIGAALGFDEIAGKSLKIDQNGSHQWRVQRDWPGNGIHHGGTGVARCHHLSQ